MTTEKLFAVHSIESNIASGLGFGTAAALLLFGSPLELSLGNYQVTSARARTWRHAFSFTCRFPLRSVRRCDAPVHQTNPRMDDFTFLAMPEAYFPYNQSKLMRPGPGTHYTSTCTSMPFFAGAAIHACIIIHLHVFLSVMPQNLNPKPLQTRASIHLTSVPRQRPTSPTLCDTAAPHRAPVRRQRI